MYWLWQAQEIATVLLLARRALAANRAPGQGVVARRVDYGLHPRQHLLLFLPADGARRRSAVFFLHGGGWYTGSPTEFAFVGSFLARHGYPAILAGYRLAPEHTYPAQHEDALAAFAYFQAHAGEWGLPGRVVVAGQSAGAHLGAFLAGERDKLAARGLDPGLIRGAFFISGPLDLGVPGGSPWGKFCLKRFLGTERDWRKTDPSRLADDWRLPLFLLHGDRDPVVNLGSALAFARRVHARRPGLVEFVVAPGRHHSDLTYLFLQELPETRALLAWLARVDEGA